MEFKIILKIVFNMMGLELTGSFAGVKSSPVSSEHFSLLIQSGNVLEHSSVFLFFCH